MTMLCLFAFAFCALIGLANLRRALWSMRLLERHRAFDAGVPDDAPAFVVLVPCLHEQLVAARLVTRMQRLEYPADRLRIVFITTAREVPDRADRTTRDVLAQLLVERRDPRLELVHCTHHRDTCKADQLTFALQALGLDREARADVFIGVYDADSAPDPRVLRYVAAHRDTARAFQQVPLYALNLHALPRGLAGVILRARPLHNALFALTIELPEMARQARIATAPVGWLRRIAGAWLSHAIGHGEFFRHDLLCEMGGFQPPSCDTQLGHALAYAGIALAPIPLFDLGETPHRLRVLTEQGVVWYNSMNTFPTTWRHVRSRGFPGYSGAAAWAMTLRLVHSNLAWALYAWGFAACLAVSALRSPSLLAMGLAALVLYLAAPAVIAARFSRLAAIADREQTPPLSAADRIAMVLGFPLEKLFAATGPWLFAVRRVAASLGWRPFTLRKTERSP